MWRSLVAHLVWDQGVAGSNPAIRTKAGWQPQFGKRERRGSEAVDPEHSNTEKLLLNPVVPHSQGDNCAGRRIA